MSTLPWKCVVCEANFYTSDLLQLHISVFHSPTGKSNQNRVSPDQAQDKSEAAEVDSDDAIDAAERERLEKKFGHLKVLRKIHRVTAESLLGVGTDNLKKEVLSADEEHLEEYSEDEDTENVKISQQSDDDMCILVVRDDGMYLAENSVKNNLSNKIIAKTEDLTQDEDEGSESDGSDRSWSEAPHTRTRRLNKLISSPGLIEMRKLKNKQIGGSKITNIKAVVEFKCKRCEKVFSTKHERRLHLESHARDLRFFCQQCGRGFRKNQGLLLHMNVHTQGSRHQCPHCHNLYRTDRYLKEHIKLHIPEEYKFECSICYKKFAHKTAFKYHMHSHYNVTPYVCSLCGKGYRQKPSLVAHMNLHAGARPFVCGVCGAGFRMKNTLRDHQRLHTDQRSYVCNQPGCDKSYVLKNQLNMHILQKHSGVRLCACTHPGCNKKFFFNSHRERHERTSHRSIGAGNVDSETEDVAVAAV